MLLLKGRQQLYDAGVQHSFFELAHTTNQMDLAKWAELGYWDEHYIPYVFMFNEEVVANVSVSIGTMIVDGKSLKVAQIGTVMTRKGYEKKGLIRRLLEVALADVAYVDIVYLFARNEVVQLYSQFGFEKRGQAKCLIETADLTMRPVEVKKLDMQDEKSRTLLVESVMHRMPVSLKLSMLQNEGIVMLHALTTYKDCVYYVPSLQMVVIAKEEGETLHIIDLIAKRPFHLIQVLQQLPITAKTIELGFTPAELSIQVKQCPINKTLFVKEQNATYPEHVRLPLTAEA